MAEQKQAASAEKTPFYTMGRGIAWLITHAFFPIRYHHGERLEIDAPYILMSNHESLLDPFILACCCKKYEIRFLGKKELTKNKVLGWLVEKVHMIAVDRHNSDMAAMRKCTKVLKEGKVLGIFPEGTRHHDELMSTIESGTAVLALRAGVPLVPVYLGRKPKLFSVTDVWVGSPMNIQDLCADGFDSAHVQTLMERIKECFFALRDDTEKMARDK